MIPQNLKYFLAQDRRQLIIVETREHLNESAVVEIRSGFMFGSRDLNKSDIFSNESIFVHKNRPNRCDRCFEVNFKYLLENDVCHMDDNNATIPKLLYLIFTKHENELQRQALRQTWLSVKNETTHVFVLGTSKNQSLHEEVVAENEKHRDILFINFHDSYQNLTYKTISSFKWVLSKCPNVTYVMKVDDDMWVNTNLLNQMMGSGLFKNTLSGNCNFRDTPFRDPTSKYYIPYSLYPKNVYPPFCSGTGYVLETSLMREIVNISTNIPFFPLEDVYIGLCMEQLYKGVTSLLPFHSWKIFTNACVYKSNFLLTSHGLSARELKELWNTPCNYPGAFLSMWEYQAKAVGVEQSPFNRRQNYFRRRNSMLQRQQLGHNRARDFQIRRAPNQNFHVQQQNQNFQMRARNQHFERGLNLNPRIPIRNRNSHVQAHAIPDFHGKSLRGRSENFQRRIPNNKLRAPIIG